MDKSAIAATFVDYRRIKTRKVHQIILEVPSETWPEVYAAMGEPSIESSEWFAVAKMHGAKPEALKGGYWAKQAALICQNPDFRRWLAVTGDFEGVRRLDEETAAKELRRRCSVTSRSHIDHDDEAGKLFRELKTDFEFWLGQAA